MNHLKAIFAVFLVCILSVNAADIPKLVAHSVQDWDAAPSLPPPQGFRNWQFGYYDKVNDPSTFKQHERGNKDYWGYGDFKNGNASRSGMSWSTREDRPNVVRRWTAQEDGTYLVSFEGTHHLIEKGKEHPASRQMVINLNGQKKEALAIPGLKMTRKSFMFDMKSGDILDFAAQGWGGSISNLTIAISKMQPGNHIIFKGTSNYTIVIPDTDPGDVSLKAAKVLQRMLKESTGAELPIIRENGFSGTTPAFFIGRTNKAVKGGIFPADLKEEEYVKKTVGKDIFIFGNNVSCGLPDTPYWRQGDLKAVCSFLEDEVGVRFLLPGKEGEEVPKMETLTIPANLNVRHCPPFPYHIPNHLVQIVREQYEPYITASNFIRRGDMRYFFGHSWMYAVNSKQFGKTHPEYFVQIGGTRHPERIGEQLCLSNPDVQQKLIELTDKSFADGWKYFQLSQSDAFFPCECDACKALGTPNERVWNFHTHLASLLEKKYPDHYINILSYEVTQKVPTWLDKMPSNVIVELTKYDEEEFQRWQRFNVKHMVYDYNWGAYQEVGFLPKRTPKRLAEQLKRFKKYNVICVYDCGGRHSWAGLEAPAAYVFNKMYDDLSLNPDLLLADYCNSSFGTAAGIVMLNFFNMMYKNLESFPENVYFTTEDPNWCNSPELNITRFYPVSTVCAMEKLLKKAEKLVVTDKQKKRLMNVRVQFDYLHSIVMAYSFFHAYQMAPSKDLFDKICDALSRREQAIDAIIASDIPKSWKWECEKKAMLRGGGLSGVLGAPFTWDYKAMLKSGQLPSMENKEAKVAPMERIPDVNDPAWDSVPANELEKIGGGKADLHAWFKMIWTKDSLAIRFHASAPGIKNGLYTSVGKEHYITGENFDVMINPTGLEDRYYQYILSPAPESFLDGRMNIGRFGADPDWNNLDLVWDSGWTTTYTINEKDGTWDAILTIPAKSMPELKLNKGQSFTMNIGRCHGNGLYLWAPNPESQTFGNTAKFGTMTLD